MSSELIKNAASTRRSDPSPFQKAAIRERRLKLLLWGDYAVGKTTLALQFPRPAVIDLEGGTNHYGGSFDFDVLPATTPGEVVAAVQWLLDHEHPYTSLVLDPISPLWEAMQRHWSEVFLRRNPASKGHKIEYYDLQPRDWQVIKAELKHLVRMLHALDMNVIVTAREKPRYAESGFMQKVGETFDAERSLPYMFDTVVRLTVDEKGRRVAHTLKDRTNKLPKTPWLLDYAVFEECFGRDTLGRAAVRAERIREDQLARLKDLIASLEMPDDQVRKRLPEYGATTLDELSAANADLIISKLDAARAANTNIGG